MSDRDTKAKANTHQLNLETGQISWLELQPHFARGRVIFLAAELDLVDVAHEFSADNRVRIETWIDQNLLAPVSDAQAEQWHLQGSEFWAVVVKPWILIQLLSTETITN